MTNNWPVLHICHCSPALFIIGEYFFVHLTYVGRTIILSHLPPALHTDMVHLEIETKTQVNRLARKIMLFFFVRTSDHPLKQESMVKIFYEKKPSSKSMFEYPRKKSLKSDFP